MYLSMLLVVKIVAPKRRPIRIPAIETMPDALPSRTACALSAGCGDVDLPRAKTATTQYAHISIFYLSQFNLPCQKNFLLVVDLS